MFDTLQRLIFRKRKLSRDDEDEDYGDDDDGRDYNNSTTTAVENFVVVGRELPDHQAGNENGNEADEDEEEEEGDMRDWTKVIPVVPKKSSSSSSSSSSPRRQQSQSQQNAQGRRQAQRQHENSTMTDSSSTRNNNSNRDFVDHDEKIARQLQEQEEMMSNRRRQQQQQQQQQPQQQQQQHDLPHLHNYINNNPFFNEPKLDPFETPPRMYRRISVYEKQRQQQQNQLNSSIQKTFKDMVGEQPDEVEQDQIQRAIELSMLDCALVPSTSSLKDKKDDVSTKQQQQRPPYQILGISEDATQTEIKAAYRKLCRLHHPDKTKGSQQDAVTKFQEISRAYKDMMQMAVTSSSSNSSHPLHNATADGGTTGLDPFKKVVVVNEDDTAYEDETTATTSTGRLKSTAHWDQELQDHRRLVNDLFQADGMDLQACVRKQQNALELLGLTFRDAGATNRNERDEIITNSCFYLSLAVSLLWGIGVLDHDNSNFDRRIGTTPSSTVYYDSDDDFDVVMAESEAEGLDVIIGDQALILKRGIEASVVKAHPEWAAQGKVGEEVQAFSDFLVYVLDTLMADIAVVVFDNTSGFCDIYKGKNYDRIVATSPQTAQANTLTLRYIPGHYQPLIPSRRDARRPLLQDIVSALDNYAVLYAICDGN